MIDGAIEIMTESVAVQSIVGRDTKTKVKVYPVRYPQEEGKTVAPDKYFVLYKAQGVPTGGKFCPGQLDQAVFNVNCCAENYSDTDEMYNVVRELFDGMAYDTTLYSFESIWYQTDYDSFDEQANRYIRVVSFACHVKRV
jgi:hypothetical protein